MPRRFRAIEGPEGRSLRDYEDGYNAGYRAGLIEFFEGKITPESTVGPRPRKKRRKTKYQAAYSAAYKRLKKKHPRMSFGSLSKKAHAAARKKVK